MSLHPKDINQIQFVSVNKGKCNILKAEFSLWERSVIFCFWMNFLAEKCQGRRFALQQENRFNKASNLSAMSVSQDGFKLEELTIFVALYGGEYTRIFPMVPPIVRPFFPHSMLMFQSTERFRNNFIYDSIYRYLPVISLLMVP